MSTPHIWQLIQRWMDGQVIRVNQSQLAEAIGVGRQTITQWKRGETRPAPANLQRLSEVTHIPYPDLTDALLRDLGYITEDREDVGQDAATTKQAGASPAPDVQVGAHIRTPTKDELAELRRRQDSADGETVEHITKQAAEHDDEGERK